MNGERGRQGVVLFARRDRGGVGARLIRNWRVVGI